jgi:hypothetical protein
MDILTVLSLSGNADVSDFVSIVTQESEQSH